MSATSASPAQSVPQSVSVQRFAGISRNELETCLSGRAVDISSLPRRLTRRLTYFESAAAACLVGLGDDLGDTPVVMASRYGSISKSLKLLKDIISGELLSPTTFSLSVHNAAIGIASQITANRAGHTAISAGTDTLRAALTECWVRLQDGASRIILLYAECRLEDEYAAFRTSDTDIHFAILLDLAPNAGTPTEASNKEDSPLHLFRAINSGADAVSW